MKNWKDVKLGDYIKIKHGFAFEGDYFSENGKHLILSPGNIKLEGGMKLTGKEKSYNGDYPEDFIFKKDDLVVVMTDLIQDAPILGGAFLISEGDKFLHNQRLGLVILKEGIDKRFLYYIFNSETYRGQVRASASGSTVKHTAPERIYDCELKLPPLSIQHEIAAILGKYDDLIANYEQQIQLLEQTAKELYREWFVRGRCPMGNEGWETKRLGDVAFDKREIVKPKDFEENTPYVGLEHLSVKSIVIRDFGTVEDVDSDKLKFVKGDILFSKIRPYLHKVCLSHFEGVCSSDAIVIKPIQNDNLGFVLFTVFSETFIDFADNISNGTKMPRSEWSVLKTYEIEMPPIDVSKAFNKIVLPIFEQIENLQRQITTLRTTRDKLLPRLLRGDLL